MGRPRVLITGAYSPYNRGDAAIVAAMAAMIREAVPGTGVSVHTFSTDAATLTAELALPAHSGLFPLPVLGSLPKRLSWVIPNGLLAVSLLLAGLGGRRTLSIYAAAMPGTRGRSLRRMLSADLIVAAGGGYLTDHHLPFLPFILLELWLCGRTGAPLVLGAQTIGPLKHSWTRRMTGWALADAAEIQARDEYTVELLATVAPNLAPRVRRVPDFALGFRELDDTVARRYPRANAPVRVGISVRRWRFPDSADPELAQTAYRQSMADLITILRGRGWDVVMVPTNHLSGGSRDDDVAAAHAVLEELDRPVRDAILVIDERATAAQLRSLISTCDVFVGTRMHACIFAITVGVPTVLVPYEPKGTGLMRRLGRPQDVCPSDPLRADELLASVDRLLEEHRQGSLQVDPDQLQALARESADALVRWLP